MEEDGEERREHPRALTDLDISLSGGGAVIDPSARALDISPEGFRVVTKAALTQGARVRFSLSMEDGPAVAGEAEIVWAKKDNWGGTEAGLRVTSMSWSDARRLRGTVYEPGFDFSKVAGLMVKAIFLLVIVAGGQNIFFHQPHARAAFVQMMPVLAVALVVLVVVSSMFSKK